MELFRSWQLRPDGWQLAVESDDGDNKVWPCWSVGASPKFQEMKILRKKRKHSSSWNSDKFWAMMGKVWLCYCYCYYCLLFKSKSPKPIKVFWFMCKHRWPVSYHSSIRFWLQFSFVCPLFINLNGCICQNFSLFMPDDPRSLIAESSNERQWIEWGNDNCCYNFKIFSSEFLWHLCLYKDMFK